MRSDAWAGKLNVLIISVKNKFKNTAREVANAFDFQTGSLSAWTGHWVPGSQWGAWYLDFRVWSDFLSPAQGSWWRENDSERHALSGWGQEEWKLGAYPKSVVAGSMPGNMTPPLFQCLEAGKVEKKIRTVTGIETLSTRVLLSSSSSEGSGSLPDCSRGVHFKMQFPASAL